MVRKQGPGVGRNQAGTDPGKTRGEDRSAAVS